MGLDSPSIGFTICSFSGIRKDVDDDSGDIRDMSEMSLPTDMALSGVAQGVVESECSLLFLQYNDNDMLHQLHQNMEVVQYLNQVTTNLIINFIKR